VFSGDYYYLLVISEVSKGGRFVEVARDLNDSPPQRRKKVGGGTR